MRQLPALLPATLLSFLLVACGGATTTGDGAGAQVEGTGAQGTGGAGATTSTDPVEPDGGAGVALAHDYELTAARTLLPPSSGGVGIASDGGSLWLAFAKDGVPPELVRVDPQGGGVLERLSCPAVTLVPGANVGGVVRDGNTFWLATGGNQNELLQLDGGDCAVLRRLGSPSELGPIDLELAGGALLLSTGTGDSFRVDPATGEVTGSFAIGDRANRDSGNAFRRGELWVASLFSDATTVFEPTTGEVLGTAVGRHYPGGGGGWDSPMCFHDGQLVTLTGDGITFYDVAPRE